MNFNLKTVITLLFIAALALKMSSCEQEDLDFYIDCDYCLDSIPEWDTLWVSVTINDENPYVPLTFYLGDIETGAEDWVDTAYDNSFWLVSEVGVEYSVKATYILNGEPVIAVDSDRLKVVDGEGECYPPCYYIRGGTLDVELKE